MNSHHYFILSNFDHPVVSTSTDEDDGSKLINIRLSADVTISGPQDVVARWAEELHLGCMAALE